MCIVKNGSSDASECRNALQLLDERDVMDGAAASGKDEVVGEVRLWSFRYSAGYTRHRRSMLDR